MLDRTSKLQLGILLSTGFFVQMGIGAIIVVLPLFAQSLGLGASGVGVLVALPQLTKLIFNLPVGHFVDTVGRKPLLIAGALIDGVGQFLTAWSSTLGQLVPARLLVGVGSATGGTVGTATTAYTMDVVGKYPEHSGLLLGITQAFGFLAFALGPTIGGIVGDRYGAKLPFMLIGAWLLLTVPLKMLLPETLPAASRKATGEALRSTGSSIGQIMQSYRELLADPRQVALLALKVAFTTGLSLILTVVPLHATSLLSASASELGRLYTFVTMTALVISPLAGAAADRLGRAKLALAGGLATALSIAALPLATSRGSYYALRALWSAGEAVLITAYSALALDVTPEDRRGARSSLDNQTGDVALLILPLLLGAVGQIVSHNAAFLLGSAIMLAANGLFARLICKPGCPVPQDD